MLCIALGDEAVGQMGSVDIVKLTLPFSELLVDRFLMFPLLLHCSILLHGIIVSLT